MGSSAGISTSTDVVGTASLRLQPNDQRRYGPDAVRRMEVLDVAKRAGFSLDEARVLLRRSDAGSPAFESLRELAARKLPEVEALIERAQSMRAWLLAATDCSCTTLDACALFDRGVAGAPHAAEVQPLRLTRVGADLQRT